MDDSADFLQSLIELRQSGISIDQMVDLKMKQLGNMPIEAGAITDTDDIVDALFQPTEPPPKVSLLEQVKSITSDIAE